MTHTGHVLSKSHNVHLYNNEISHRLTVTKLNLLQKDT